MIPPKYAHVVFAFVLSGLMSLVVSGISTVRVLGIEPGLAAAWLSSWAPSWAVAFPGVLVVAPLTRRIVALLVRGEDGAG